MLSITCSRCFRVTRPTVLMPGPYTEWDMPAMEQDYTLLRLWEADDRAELIARHAAEVRAIATRGDLGASTELIAALPNLEFIGCFGVGTDGIDLEAARARGIRVTNTPDVLTDDVADLALALMLGVTRKLFEGERHVRDGDWLKGNMPLATRLWGKRLGIVGMGRIGQAVARRAAAFSMEISYFGRSAQPDLPYAFVPDLVELAHWSEVLVATLAGGAATRGLIDSAVFEALGPEGYFVNVARGSVVDEPALIAALQTRRIKAAGLDVFLNEPHIDRRFLALDNVVLQPHHGSGTVETRQAMGQLVRDNLAAHFAGRPLLTEVV